MKCWSKGVKCKFWLKCEIGEECESQPHHTRDDAHDPYVLVNHACEPCFYQRIFVFKAITGHIMAVIRSSEMFKCKIMPVTKEKEEENVG